MYNNELLETVDHLNYLGITFNYTGTFKINIEIIYGKGVKAMNSVISNINKYKTNPKISLQLVDAFVSPTISYGCKVWGFAKENILEKIYIKCCKQILGIRQNSCNAAVYSELGRYPIHIRYIRIVKYWLRIINTDTIILRTVINTCLNNAHNGRVDVKNILSRYGFLYVWENPNITSTNVFISKFRKTVVDVYIQEWRTHI